MTRRARRRLYVIGTAALVGASIPFWAPRLLASFPAFRVARVEVVGTRYVAPDEVVRLAGVSPEASVWDDPSEWERRVESHPMITEARVHRVGARGLEIRVVEEKPVALAATPLLVPVNSEGRVLPLDPAASALDLPVLEGHAGVRDGWLSEESYRALARLLGRLAVYRPAFVQKISEVKSVEGGAAEIRLMESSVVGRILLPLDEPVRALRRVELALGEARDRKALAADARFAEQVVLRFREARRVGPVAAAAEGREGGR